MEPRSREPFAPTQGYGFIRTFSATWLPSCTSMPIRATMRLSGRVLGHRSLQTTVDFYTGLETPAAVRHFDKTILNLRTKSAAEGPKRPKEDMQKTESRGNEYLFVECY